jgi:hypothetical protein
MTRNKKRLIFIFVLITLYCFETPAQIVFKDMSDTTVYLCHKKNKPDSLFLRNIVFKKNVQSDMFVIDFLITHSSPDTIWLKDRKLLIVDRYSENDSLIIFNFYKPFDIHKGLMPFNSGFGIKVYYLSQTERKKIKYYQYRFSGLSSHSSYISDLEVSYENGITNFNWYDGNENCKCKLNNIE